MSQSITRRLLDRKRHTIGFVVGNNEYTRLQTIRLAKRGEISGVRVCKGPQGPYLTSTTTTSLYALPFDIKTKSRRSTSKVAAKRATVPAKTTRTSTPRKSRKA